MTKNGQKQKQSQVRESFFAQTTWHILIHLQKLYMRIHTYMHIHSCAKFMGGLVLHCIAATNHCFQYIKNWTICGLQHVHLCVVCWLHSSRGSSLPGSIPRWGGSCWCSQGAGLGLSFQDKRLCHRLWTWCYTTVSVAGFAGLYEQEETYVCTGWEWQNIFSLNTHISSPLSLSFTI